MSKVIIVWSELNEMGFGLEVDEKDAKEVAKIAEQKFSDWFDTDNHPEYHHLGYAEPTIEELETKGIKYRLLDEDEITDPENENLFIADAEVIRI